MNKFFISVLLLSFFFIIHSYANDLYFAQMADGGGYVTQINIANLGDTSTSISLALYKSDGSPMTVTIGEDTKNNFFYNIPPHGSIFLRTSGTARDVSAGWARVNSSGIISGSLIYRYIVMESVISEAGLDPSSIMDGFVFMVDTRQMYYSGVAIANPGTESAIVQYRLYSSSGQSMMQCSEQMGAMRHTAKLIGEIFPNQNLTDFTGKVVVTILGGQVAATTLRFDGSLISFASIPVVPRTPSTSTTVTSSTFPVTIITTSSTTSTSTSSTKILTSTTTSTTIGSTSTTIPHNLSIDRDKVRITQSGTSVKITGKVVNHDVADAIFVQVAVNAYDSKSLLIGGDSTYIYGTNRAISSSFSNSCLLPGEYGYFYLYITVSDNAASLDLFPFAEVRKTLSPLGKLTVTDHTISSDNYGYAKVIGNMKNTGTIGITYALLNIIYLNSSHQVTGTDSFYPEVRTLSVNQTMPFSESSYLPPSHVSSVWFSPEWSDESTTYAIVGSDTASNKMIVKARNQRQESLRIKAIGADGPLIKIVGEKVSIKSK